MTGRHRSNRGQPADGPTIEFNAIKDPAPTEYELPPVEYEPAHTPAGSWRNRAVRYLVLPGGLLGLIGLGLAGGVALAPDPSTPPPGAVPSTTASSRTAPPSLTPGPDDVLPRRPAGGPARPAPRPTATKTRTITATPKPDRDRLEPTPPIDVTPDDADDPGTDDPPPDSDGDGIPDDQEHEGQG